MTYKRRTEWSWRSGGAALPVVAALVLAASANGQCVPSILGSVDTPDVARGVAVSGTVAYVADDRSGLQVIDVSSCELCPADLDGSGSVDFGDILAIHSAWGNKGGPEDLDGSGFVDIGDILAVLAAWGPCE